MACSCLMTPQAKDKVQIAHYPPLQITRTLNWGWKMHNEYGHLTPVTVTTPVWL